MVLLVVSNHVSDPEKGRREGARLGQICARIAAVEFEVVHFASLPAWLERHGHRVLGMISCGFPDDYASFDLERQRPQMEYMRRSAVPVLGICGGHQIMAMAFSGECGPMDRGAREEGFNKVYRAAGGNQLGPEASGRVRGEAGPWGALDRGLPDCFEVWQEHYWEVKRVPAGFRVLLTGETCRVQGIQHCGRPLGGVQFHPEKSDRSHPHGESIICNFLQWCGVRPGPVG